jgi:hypothetical protein
MYVGANLSIFNPIFRQKYSQNDNIGPRGTSTRGRQWYWRAAQTPGGPPTGRSKVRDPHLSINLVNLVSITFLFVSQNCGKYYCYLSRRIRVFPANFPLSVFDRQIIDAMQLCPLISIYPLLSYTNHCTAHYSSVLFWIHFCQDQIKVIARSHPCHHFHKTYQLNSPFL